MSPVFRPCYLCGQSYPGEPSELNKMLENILARRETSNQSKGRPRAIITPHIDLSHIGLKFGHENPAEYIASRAETHDRNLLRALTMMESELLWEESGKVEDQYDDSLIGTW